MFSLYYYKFVPLHIIIKPYVIAKAKTILLTDKSCLQLDRGFRNNLLNV